MVPMCLDISSMPFWSQSEDPPAFMICVFKKEHMLRSLYINGVKSECIGVRIKSYVQLLTVSILDLMIRLIEIQIY